MKNIPAKKLQIRRIEQMNGNVFDIYDVMYYKNTFLGYVSVGEDYETLEDALKMHPGIDIEDKRNC